VRVLEIVPMTEAERKKRSEKSAVIVERLVRRVSNVLPGGICAARSDNLSAATHELPVSGELDESVRLGQARWMSSRKKRIRSEDPRKQIDEMIQELTVDFGHLATTRSMFKTVQEAGEPETRLLVSNCQ
jgi:hypothetical protein